MKGYQQRRKGTGTSVSRASDQAQGGWERDFEASTSSSGNHSGFASSLLAIQRAVEKRGGHAPPTPSSSQIIQCQPEKRAVERGIALEKPVTNPKALVMDPSKNAGKSMAANPALEQEALAFEKNLGIAAFNDPRANQAAGQMCQRLNRYLDRRFELMVEAGNMDKELGMVVKQMTGDAHFAGAVTTFDTSTVEKQLDTLAAIMSVLEVGNLRERMNMIDQFMKILRRDFKQAEADEQRWKRFISTVTAADMDAEAFTEQQGKGELFDENPEVTSTIKETRNDIRVLANKPADQQMTELTPSSLGEAPLSDLEMEHQQVHGKHSGGYAERLKFTEGARVFLVNENSAWVQKMRALSLPLKAGPSGHTKIFFEANKFLGTNLPPNDVRLAAIGHLLPINAHSLIEIMEIAKDYGCPYDEGVSIYKQVLPFDLPQLRLIGGGSFPGETELEATEASASETETYHLADHSKTVFASSWHRKQKQFYRVPDSIAHDDQAAIERQQTQTSTELSGLHKGRHVSAMLGDKGLRGKLEAHVAAPKLTTNVRDALKLADQISADAEPEFRKKVEEKLAKMGFDLKQNPDLYDKIVGLMQSSPVTINFKTTAIETLFQSRFYQNQWERSVHPRSGKKAYYGDGGYARDRDKTERILHGLPELEEIGEAAESINPHAIAELTKLRKEVATLKASLASGETEKQLQAQETLRTSLAGQIKVSSLAIVKQYDQTLREEMIVVRDRFIASREASLKKTEALKEEFAEKQKKLALLSQNLIESELAFSTGKDQLRPTKVESGKFREKRSLPVDRPHSAAIGPQHRGGAAVNVSYGASHMVLRDAVKQRSTVTGGDSLEQIWKKGLSKREVSTFKHMGAALFHANDMVLKLLAQHALNPDAPKDKLPKMLASQSLPYLEAQVFGPIDLARDVEKLVIDEAELDAWAAGEAYEVYKPGVKVPKKPKAELKKMIEDYAESMGIEVVYIDSGTAADVMMVGAVRAPGEDITDFVQPFEIYTEKTLKSFRAKDWAGGIAEALKVEPRGKGSILGPSYKTTGLTGIVELEKELHDLKTKGAEDKEEAYAELSGRLLKQFYRTAMKVKHANEFERVLANVISFLREAVLEEIYLPKAADNLLVQKVTDKQGMSKLWRTSTPKQKQKLLSLISLDPELKGLSDLGYLLEALDEESASHYHRRNLQMQALEWARSRSEENFFEWLKAEPTRKMAGEALHNVSYFSEQEAENHRLNVAGKITNAKTGDALVGDNIFVLDPTNVFYGAEKVAGKIQHSTFLAGGPVRAAGHLYTDGGGKLTRISNESGHYRPTKANILYALALLKKHAVDLTAVEVEIDKKVVAVGGAEYESIETEPKQEHVSGFSRDKYTKALGKYGTSRSYGSSGTKTKSASSGTETEETSSSTVPTKKGINNQYLYEDNDMYALLNQLIVDHQIPNAYVVPPCDNIIGQQLRTSLETELHEHQGTDRKVLIPYNIGNYHWVGIYLDISNNEAAVNVSYMDPLTAAEAIPANVTQEVRAVYAEAAIAVAARNLQTDASSCGPITIKNLIAMARAQHLEANVLMDYLQTADLRQEHVGIMNAHFPDAQFETRQRDNISTVSSAFDTMKYLSESATANFSPAEYKKMLQVIKSIRALGDVARQHILAAFSLLKKDPEVVDFYATLRKAVFNSMQIVKLGVGNDAERLVMGEILKELWGVTFDFAEQAADFDDKDIFRFHDFEEIKKIALTITQEGAEDELILKLDHVMKSQAAAQDLIKKKFGKKEM